MVCTVIMVKLVRLLERIMGDERRMYLVGDLELFKSSSSRAEMNLKGTVVIGTGAQVHGQRDGQTDRW